MKRFFTVLSILLAMAMLLATLSLTASAGTADLAAGGENTVVLSGTCTGTTITYKVYRLGTTTDYRLLVTGDGAIPSYYGVALPWQEYMANITEIEISGNISEIGRNFFHCGYTLSPKPKSLKLDYRVKYIREGAFYNANITNSVEFKNVTLVEQDAFKGNSITALTFCQGNCQIAPYAFADGSRLNTVYFSGPIGTGFIVQNNAFRNSPVDDVYFNATEYEINSGYALYPSGIKTKHLNGTPFSNDPTMHYYMSDGVTLTTLMGGHVVDAYNGCTLIYHLNPNEDEQLRNAEINSVTWRECLNPVNNFNSSRIVSNDGGYDDHRFIFDVSKHSNLLNYGYTYMWVEIQLKGYSYPITSGIYKLNYDKNRIGGVFSITVTEPKAGNRPVSRGEVDRNDCTVSAVTYYDAEGNPLSTSDTFKEGQRYTVRVRMKTKESGKVFVFDDSLFYINGQPADILSAQNYGDITLGEATFRLPTVIDRTSVTVTKPAAGSFPTFSATAKNAIGWDVESSYSMGYYQNGVLWRNVTDGYYMTSQTSDANNRFEKGKRYQVTVSLVVTSNYYVFAEKSLVTGSVNQNYATVGDYNDGKEGQNIYLQYTFDLDDVIRNMSFTVSEPAVDGKPVWSVEYPSGARYSCDDLTVGWEEDSWTMMKSDTFKAGKDYTVKLRVDADDDCRFTDETVALINGRTAEITEKWTDSYGKSHARVEYTFSLASGKLLGDVDGDKKVDIFDASSIQKSIAGMSGYPNYNTLDKNSVDFKIADVDKDGKVDIFDASLIQKYIAGDASAKFYGIGQPM